jgi:hypothetical protein
MPRPSIAYLTLLILGTAGTALAQQSGFGSELFKKEAFTVRLDAAADPKTVRVSQAGTAILVNTPAAALIWRPADRATRDYTVRATIRLKAGSSAGAGLFFAGWDLEGMDRNYAACMVRADGSWSIPHRYGIENHDFRPWERHEAVKAASETADAVNVVEWTVGTRSECRINGVLLYGFESDRGVQPGALRTIDGDVGVRVDAGADVVFERFEVVRGARSAGTDLRTGSQP